MPPKKAGGKATATKKATKAAPKSSPSSETEKVKGSKCPKPILAARLELEGKGIDWKDGLTGDKLWQNLDRATRDKIQSCMRTWLKTSSEDGQEDGVNRETFISFSFSLSLSLYIYNIYIYT